MILGILSGSAACSDEDAPAPAAEALFDAVAAEGFAGTDDAENDADLGAAPVGPDAPSLDCPGGPGCPCSQNTDCGNALCIEDPGQPDGLACARPCIESCPTGYKCAQISGSSGDVISICVAQFGHLCEPCATSKDCESLGLKDAACVDQASLGRFCGVACGTAKDCPAGYDCQSVPTAETGQLKQCVRVPDGQTPFGTCPCSVRAVAKKLATTCHIEVKGADGTVSGKCAGKRTCLATGLTACSAPAAVVEVCDGADNDCDGQTDEAACDDGKACTKDTCKGAEGCEYKVADGDPCDADGSVCTIGDACKVGVCEPGKALDCDDKNPCTKDSCDLAKGCTQVTFDGLPCDADGTACTQGDVCLGSACQKGKVVACDDGNPCTEDVCDSKSGQCQSKPIDDGVPCDDGTKCTNKDACAQGICKGKAVNCDDGNPCTDDVCDAKTGCGPTPLTGAPCSDDNPCTLGDLCKGGSCEKGKPKSCDSPDGCISAKCNLADGACKFADVDDGLPCTDGNACTAADTCKIGTCKGKVIDCDDKNPCTDDACDAQTGCKSISNTAPCTDGNACTELDKCVQAKCTGQPKNLAVECGDGNPCTTDGCDAKNGCIYTANQASCDDGNGCTEGDQCTAKACESGTNTCGCQKDGDCAQQEDGNSCNGKLICDKAKVPFLCKVNPKTIVNCDTSADSTCLVTNCQPKTGQCAAVAEPDGKTCDADGSVCTQSDACKLGTCTKGSAAQCNDQNPCTTDACDTKSGCTHLANDAPCDADANACTIADMCQNSLCVAGPKKSCSDGEFCTSDGCNSKSGACAYDGVPLNGKACDGDGSVCTDSDACNAGACVPGKVKACSDNNLCTDDVCDAKAGCKFTANLQPCNDNSACTGSDACAGGKCAGLPFNPGVDCDDGNPCTTDSCDPKSGCLHAANQSPCDDGNLCTVGDTCADKVCTSGTNTCGCQKDADCTGQEDGNLCNGTLYCDKQKLPYTCKVNPKTVVACDTSADTACFQTTCSVKTGLCGPLAEPEGKSCDADGSVCTQNDQCKQGLCAKGAAADCGDGNACTTDACDAKAGCSHASNTAACNADDNACTVADACLDKACVAGAKKNCGDGELCTADSCDVKTGGCVYDGAAQAGKGCDADGSVCTVGDACKVGKCQSGEKKACIDGTPCTDDGCDAKTGCVFLPNSATCTDGNACTSGDACQSGDCESKAVVCNDGNACTNDSCDKAKGCLFAANLATCDDKNACTASDTCGAGTCTGSATPCDDKNPCTADSCDAVQGCQAVPIKDGAACSADGQKWCQLGKCIPVLSCGDGVVNQASEQCDDGGNLSGDGCSGDCKQECGTASLAGIVARYLFDGDVADATANKLAGQLVGPALQFPPDRCTGKAMQGTATNFINLPNDSRLTATPSQALSVAFWARLPTGQGGMVMARYKNDDVAGSNFFFSLAPNLFRATGNGSNVIDAPLSLGTGWTHFAAVIAADGGAKLYVAGKPAATATLNLSKISSFVTTIGTLSASDGQSADYRFRGQIDDLQVYNRVLAPAEIAGIAKDVQPVCDANSLSCLGNLAGTCNDQGSGLVSATDCKPQGNFCLAGKCVSLAPSCKDELTADPAAKDGVYPIDPDGAGPIAAANLFCDMKNGGWTLVGAAIGGKPPASNWNSTVGVSAASAAVADATFRLPDASIGALRAQSQHMRYTKSHGVTVYGVPPQVFNSNKSQTLSGFTEESIGPPLVCTDAAMSAGCAKTWSDVNTGPWGTHTQAGWGDDKVAVFVGNGPSCMGKFGVTGLWCDDSHWGNPGVWLKLWLGP